MKNMLQLLIICVLFSLSKAQIAPTAGFNRCKAVVKDSNYKVTRMDCGTNMLLCWSNWWRYELTLEAGEKCYIASDDFGNFIVDLRTFYCPKPKLTSAATYANYATGKDQLTTTAKNQCAAPTPQALPSYGTTNVPIYPGGSYDYSGYCDAMVTLTADASINTSNNECATFVIYGNNHGSYL